MELLSVIAAKSSWLFDLGDLNPEGRALSDLLPFLKNECKFTTAPTSLTDLDPVTKSLTFRQGAFRIGDGPPKAVELTIYSDGLSANTFSSTADTDAFLNEVLTNASTAFGLHYSQKIIRGKYYLSELNVRLDRGLTTINEKLNQFARKLSSKIDPKNESLFEPGGVSFWTDSFSAAIKMDPFTIERKVGSPFSENRYFSRAPLQTADHLALLNEFERLLIL